MYTCVRMFLSVFFIIANTNMLFTKLNLLNWLTAIKKKDYYWYQSAIQEGISNNCSLPIRTIVVIAVRPEMPLPVNRNMQTSKTSVKIIVKRKNKTERELHRHLWLLAARATYVGPLRTQDNKELLACHASSDTSEMRCYLSHILWPVASWLCLARSSIIRAALAVSLRMKQAGFLDTLVPWCGR